MNETAAYALILILIGNPASMVVPLLVARYLVHKHDTTPATFATEETR
ncbi:hypothetical protein OG423_05145 [Micromonospora zamorensis]|uniref:Uncharacterized protein n=1 Tax=Micromonospora zamorensis TaxID=709883 RepID=A0ABZ1PIM6_9ACTN|nr:hypothetical protein OG423_05145 [Micromonospora zamorensis]